MDLLDRLESAGFEIDRDLCSGVNPTLQIIYKRWTVANNLISEVDKMVNQGKWSRELGKPPNKTELIELFVAKTSWHQTYAKLIPRALQYEDMEAWLKDDPDCLSGLELWGYEPQSRYTTANLKDWLDAEEKKKLMKKPAAKKVKATREAVQKGKAKESQVASGSGSGSGKDKEKEKAKESAGGKKSHKKVTKG